MPNWNRAQIYWLSRSIILLVVFGSIGTLFWYPPNPLFYLLDVLLRSYLIFLGTVMAHEASHGHLGSSKAANFWWGRLALAPSMVPYTNFRKTHQLHHAYTNIPDKDPDYFMKPGQPWEILLRALFMPHQWFFWLLKRGRIKRADVAELSLNYLAVFTVYTLVAYFAGFSRLLAGLLPALVLVSIFLWYPFALKTHEGFSTGPPESRSHNYYGRFIYWCSLGLSMHRVHHMKPQLAWIELKAYVEEARGLLPRRDIRLQS